MCYLLFTHCSAPASLFLKFRKFTAPLVTEVLLVPESGQPPELRSPSPPAAAERNPGQGSVGSPHPDRALRPARETQRGRQSFSAGSSRSRPARRRHPLSPPLPRPPLCFRLATANPRAAEHAQSAARAGRLPARRESAPPGVRCGREGGPPGRGPRGLFPRPGGAPAGLPTVRRSGLGGGLLTSLPASK